MIRVVRIAGEIFDLETKKSTPKALVLSNGIRELSIHIEDDTAVAVIALMKEAELLSRMRETKAPDVEVNPETGFELAPLPAEGAFLEGEENTSEKNPDIEQDGPGAEYNDPLTGAGSL